MLKSSGPEDRQHGGADRPRPAAAVSPGGRRHGSATDRPSRARRPGAGGRATAAERGARRSARGPMGGPQAQPGRRMSPCASLPRLPTTATALAAGGVSKVNRPLKPQPRRSFSSTRFRMVGAGRSRGCAARSPERRRGGRPPHTPARAPRCADGPLTRLPFDVARRRHPGDPCRADRMTPAE